MNTTTMRRGALAGMAGGVVMAMWSMLALAGGGDGFWTPVNLIAHLAWDGAPLDGAFSFGALVLGVMIHMATSMMLGVAIAVAIGRFGLDRTSAAALGMTIGLGVWAVNQYGIWQALDSAASDHFTPWVFALGHLMFGAVTGAVAAIAHTAGATQPSPTPAGSHTAP